MNFWAKEENGELVFSNKRELSNFLSENKGKTFSVTLKRERGIRTDNQNRSLHLYFTHVAQELNAGGYTVQLAVKERMDLDFTPEIVKELIWRPAQKAIIKKVSTTTLDKVSDINEVYETVNRHLAEKFGIHVPWPSEQTKNELQS
jgi:hypothetical protein